MLLIVNHVERHGLLADDTPKAVIGGIRAWTFATMLMFALAAPAALFIGRWVMAIWLLGYLGLRLAAVLYTRSGRGTESEAPVGDAVAAD